MLALTPLVLPTRSPSLTTLTLTDSLAAWVGSTGGAGSGLHLLQPSSEPASSAAAQTTFHDGALGAPAANLMPHQHGTPRASGQSPNSSVAVQVQGHRTG